MGISPAKEPARRDAWYTQEQRPKQPAGEGQRDPVSGCSVDDDNTVDPPGGPTGEEGSGAPDYSGYQEVD